MSYRKQIVIRDGVVTTRIVETRSSLKRRVIQAEQERAFLEAWCASVEGQEYKRAQEEEEKAMEREYKDVEIYYVNNKPVYYKGGVVWE
jgi:hypothetical protein